MAELLRQNQLRYIELKQDLASTFLANLSENEMSSILNNFQNNIKSSRAFSHIRKLEDLFKILEARNILSAENVTPLEIIAELASRPNAIKRIDDYKRGSSQPAPPVIPQGEPQITPTETVIPTPVFGTVCEAVCDMLGQDWKTLARNLSIMHEGHINEIQNNHRISDNQRTHQVLAEFQRRYPNEEQELIERLIKALKDIRRHQLVRKIQPLLPAHYRA